MALKLSVQQEKEILVNPTNFNIVRMSEKWGYSYDDLYEFVKERLPDAKLHHKIKELTQEQQLWIFDHSLEYSITEMADKYNVPYNTVYNFCKKHQLKYSLSKPQKDRVKTAEVISYADIMKERAAVIPDPPRKWKRVNDGYSNQQHEDLINKILNDGE